MCGEVTFSIQGEVHDARYCHCRTCRKFAGTSPAAWGVVQRANLHITAPTSAISRYHSGGGLRCFCSKCGCPLWFEPDAYASILGLPLGVLEGPDIKPPVMHVWTSAKPAWSHISSNIPQHPSYPGLEQPD